jgi:PhnB protein
MKLLAHLHFKGNCREAFSFYADLFGGQIEFAATFGEMPGAQVPQDMRDKLAHARLNLKGEYLLGCDAPADRFQAPQGFNIMSHIDIPDEAERVFNRLAELGTIIMPFQQTSWAYRFGMCNDRFGIPWMVNCEKAR